MSRPPLEVADVVRQHGAAFLARYGPTLSGEQHRALRAIGLCRTAPLGGHITQCDSSIVRQKFTGLSQGCP
jgi:hypothetical protein